MSRGRALAAATAIVASAGISLSVTQANGPGQRSSAEPVPPAGISSVGRDQAGVLTPADPWILHHHGVNTAEQARSAPERAAERFHHR
jgi:hypothetical protein